MTIRVSFIKMHASCPRRKRSRNMTDLKRSRNKKQNAKRHIVR